ncbi:MAG: serine/threonine transporter SstT [Firmicutes bacterium]|nr:serine/threonine transporter SstT [Bacillota bacterium]
MKELFIKWNSISLIKRIVCGLIIGVILALVVPQATVVTIFGSLFTGALKAVAPVLVFVLVMSSLASSKGEGAGNMKTVLFFYLASTLIASVVAVLFSFVAPTELVLTAAAENSAPEGIGQVIKGILVNAVANPVASMANANYIGVLTWAAILGTALKVASDNTKQVLSNLADALGQAVQWVISFAPFGVMGLVFEAVSTSGLDIFAVYGKLILVLVGAMLFIAFVTNPLMVFVATKKNPYPLLFTCVKESGITAFFTRSSAANIPMNMALCKKLGLNEDNYSVSIPLGATINMNGAAITITVMTLAAATTLGISVDIPSAIILSVLASISACGASGVAGGSLLLIPLACSLFGISNDVAMQVVGVGFIIGVIQDSVETALNSSADVLFTATAEYYQKRKAGIPFEMVPKK